MSDDSKLDLRAAGGAALYRFTFRDKVVGALGALRLRLPPRHPVLMAGPYVGEFGCELMQWQGFVRAQKRVYKSVHVLSYPGRDYLYEGCTVHYHDYDLKQAGYGYGRIGPQQAREMARAKAAEAGLRDYDIFEPSLLCTQYHKMFFWRQDFRLLDEPPMGGRICDVAFHFRAVRKEGPDHAKNYDPTLADELAALCIAHGLSVICVGHPDYSYCAKGCEDMRRVNLRESEAAICSA